MLLFMSCCLISFHMQLHSTEDPQPVDHKAIAEVSELLNFLCDLSGEQTLSGQHDYPMSGPYFYRYTKEITGQYPAVMGRDLGFSPPDTLDGINYRQRTIDELIAASEDGVIVTLMWHAVPPTSQEPVEFKGGVQSKLNKQQWKELITPGTEMHERWKSQVDAIAPFLVQLQYARVPVLWRPYHEMNGPWFWWGNKPGEYGYKALYRMLYDRLVNFHGIHNLLWVFNGNQVVGNVKPYADFYPGDDVVDILATDVYRTFETSDYQELLELGKGKPIALGEVGPFPSNKYLKSHPKWLWFMSWSEFMLKSDRKVIKKLYDSEQVLGLSDLNKYRSAE